MMFTSSVAPSNLTVLPGFLLPPERASFSLCVRCMAYLADFFVLCFPARPFLGLVGEADYSPFLFTDMTGTVGIFSNLCI